MNLIHRYVFGSVFLACAGAVGVFSLVLMLGNTVKELIGPVLAGQIPPGVFLRLLVLMIPVVGSYALPMGMLTGILLVLGRMSSDREITALRAAGLSVAWLSAPILLLALLGVGVGLVINFRFMPVAKVAYETELRNVVRLNPLSFIVPRTFIRDFPGMVLYVERQEGDRLGGFWLWELDASNRVRRMVRADSGALVYDEAHNQLVLTLRHAQAERRDEKDPEDFRAAHGAVAWEEATFQLSLGRVAGTQFVKKKLQWLTFTELLGERARLQSEPGRPAPERDRGVMRVQMAIQEKFATAFSVLSFALIGIPLGIRISRRETSANLGLGLALAMVYYFGTIMVGWLDGRPALRPDLLMWLPNVAFQFLGCTMLYRLDRG